jgi:hypothetical protein
MLGATGAAIEVLDLGSKVSSRERGREVGSVACTERRGSRTHLPPGYDGVPILKTGWATGPMPLQAWDPRCEEWGARQYFRQRSALGRVRALDAAEGVDPEIETGDIRAAAAVYEVTEAVAGE